MNTWQIMLTDGRVFSYAEYRARFVQTPVDLDPTVIARVGTRTSGRRLDGREWLQFPVVREERA